MAEGVIARSLPIPSADNASVQISNNRRSRHGESYVLNKIKFKHVSADEGSFFVAQNATPGTGVAKNAAGTSFVDTIAMFVMQNTLAASAQSKSIYLDTLTLICTTAQVAGLQHHFAFKKSTTSREATTAANRTVVTGVNMRASGPTSIAKLMAFNATGVHTVPASAPQDSFYGRVTVPSGAQVIHDVVMLDFGADMGMTKSAATAAHAGDPCFICIPAPPVVIDPGEWLVIHEWAVTEGGAPAYEYQLTWMEM